MPTIASSIVLPSYVSVDGAFETFVPLPQVVGSFFNFHTVPGDYFEEVVTLSFNLTTDATAGSRTVSVEIRIPGAVVTTVPSGATQAPSTVKGYTFSSDYSAVVAPSNALVAQPFPRLVLPPTYQLFIDTAGGGGGDIYSSMSLYLRRYPTDGGDRSEPIGLPTPVLV